MAHKSSRMARIAVSRRREYPPVRRGRLHVGVWIFLLGLLVGAVLLKDVPSLGVSLTWGRNPAVAASAIAIGLCLLLALMFVTRLLEDPR